MVWLEEEEEGHDVDSVELEEEQIAAAKVLGVKLLGVDTVDADAVVDKHCFGVLFVDYSSHFEASYLSVSAGEHYQQDIERSMEAHIDENQGAAVVAAEERTLSWGYRYRVTSILAPAYH